MEPQRRRNMRSGLELSARSVAGPLAQIFGPSIYDVPRFGGGDPIRHGLTLPGGPQPEPWRWVMLNPQPLPPREPTRSPSRMRTSGSFRAMIAWPRYWAAGLRSARWSDRCAWWPRSKVCPPRWPRWPKVWPPPPPPPWSREEMTPTESFVFGGAHARCSRADGARATPRSARRAG